MNFSSDLKYSFRSLKTNWSHSLLCIIVIGLAIGLSWTALSIYYRIFHTPVAFHEGEHWYGVMHSEVDDPLVRLNHLDVFTYQALNSRLEGLEVAGGFRIGSANLSTDSTSVPVISVAITPSIFTSSGIEPGLGRGLLPSDTGAAPSIVLNHTLWANEFGADADVVGSSVVFNGVSHTVVGVMDKGDFLVAPFDVYVPLRIAPVSAPNPDQRITPIFKLNATTELGAINRQAQQIIDQLDREYPGVYADRRQVWLAPLNQVLSASNLAVEIAMNIWGIAGIVILVLACVNIANLLIARAAEQRQEYSLRSALGSSRARLIRLALLNSAHVCLLGGVLGAAISYAAGYYMVYLTELMAIGINETLPVDTNATPTAAEFVILVASVGAIWLFSSILPVFLVLRQEPSEVLAGSTKGTTGAGGFRFSRITISLQVICSCFLLVVSGTLVYAMEQFNTTDYGFDANNLWTAILELPDDQFAHYDRLQFARELTDELERNNEAEAAAVSTALPGAMNARVRFRLRDRDLMQNGEFAQTSIVAVDPQFKPALSTSILQGRNFDSGDTAESAPVVIIDERLAKNWWPDETAVGKQIQLHADQNGTWATVVGISSRIVPTYPGAFAGSLIYQPLSQSTFDRLALVVRTRANATDTVALIRDATRSVDRNVAAYRILPMTEHFRTISAGISFFSVMFASVALATVILAVVGIYGVVARSVTLRTVEIGIRRALGSSAYNVVWVYLRRSLVYVGIGCLLGGGAALLLADTISNFLDSQPYAIPLVYLAVCAGLVVFVSLATYFPARKAVTLETGDALRYE